MQTVGYDGSHRPEPPGGDVGVGQGGLLVAVGVGWGGRGVGVAVGGGGGVVGVAAAWPAVLGLRSVSGWAKAADV